MQKILYGLALVFGLQSCDYDEVELYQPNEEERTVAGFISNNFEFTLLSSALQYTGLMDTLNNHLGNYTLLAPPNSAFEALGITRPSDFYQLDKDSLYKALAFHIIPQRLLVDDIPFDNGIVYTTLEGMEQQASKVSYVTTTYLTFSGSRVTTFDQAFINGNVQVLDKVLKFYPKGSIKQWLEENEQYSIFTAGLRHFNLLDLLGNEDRNFSVFAPDNEEFESRGITVDSIARMDVNKLIGARLFGAYIVPDLLIFISDFRYYYYNSGQQFVTRVLEDDEDYHQNLTGYSHNVPGQQIFPQTALDQNLYSFGISKLAFPYGQYPGKSSSLVYDSALDFDLFLGSGRQSHEAQTYGDRPERNDHIASNGLIHDIHALLVLPDEALKN
ncbi:fasciclin domain-containing protein [Sphingobacterium sp. LRF_L2]|uniref:fasciclin domain-containing protein n=1 Tax=Sphingobacterium sp. LRF_L2 TaxID=3369421 RepID=UPI003F5DEFD6